MNVKAFLRFLCRLKVYADCTEEFKMGELLLFMSADWLLPCGRSNIMLHARSSCRAGSALCESPQSPNPTHYGIPPSMGGRVLISKATTNQANPALSPSVAAWGTPDLGDQSHLLPWLSTDSEMTHQHQSPALCWKFLIFSGVNWKGHEIGQDEESRKNQENRRKPDPRPQLIHPWAKRRRLYDMSHALILKRTENRSSVTSGVQSTTWILQNNLIKTLEGTYD